MVSEAGAGCRGVLDWKGNEMITEQQALEIAKEVFDSSEWDDVSLTRALNLAAAMALDAVGEKFHGKSSEYIEWHVTQCRQAGEGK